MKFSELGLIDKILYAILYLTGHGIGVFIVSWGVLELLYKSTEWWKLVVLGLIWHSFVKFCLYLYIEDTKRFDCKYKR